MTPNQKAATYVGWSPCNGQVPCDRLSHEKPIPDSETFHGCSIWTHDAPDMSRPENYMRALSTALEKGWDWSIGNSRKNGPRTYIMKQGDRFIEKATPVEALTALYDAERPE